MVEMEEDILALWLDLTACMVLVIISHVPQDLCTKFSNGNG